MHCGAILSPLPSTHKYWPTITQKEKKITYTHCQVDLMEIQRKKKTFAKQ